MNKLQDIIEEIQRLQKELLLEIQKKEDEFFYKIKGKKVYFEAETRKCHKAFATKIHTYLFNASFLNILTTPIISKNIQVRRDCKACFHKLRSARATYIFHSAQRQCDLQSYNHKLKGVPSPYSYPTHISNGKPWI